MIGHVTNPTPAAGDDPVARELTTALTPARRTA
jgi:hypothetical protein